MMTSEELRCVLIKARIIEDSAPWNIMFYFYNESVFITGKHYYTGSSLACAEKLQISRNYVTLSLRRLKKMSIDGILIEPMVGKGIHIVFGDIE